MFIILITHVQNTNLYKSPLVSLPHPRDSQLPNPKYCPPVFLTTVPFSPSAPLLSLTHGHSHHASGLPCLFLILHTNGSETCKYCPPVKPNRCLLLWSLSLRQNAGSRDGVEGFGDELGGKETASIGRPGGNTGQYHKRANKHDSVMGRGTGFESDYPSPALIRGVTSSKWLNHSGRIFIICQLN